MGSSVGTTLPDWAARGVSNNTDNSLKGLKRCNSRKSQAHDLQGTCSPSYIQKPVSAQMRSASLLCAPAPKKTQPPGSPYPLNSKGTLFPSFGSKPENKKGKSALLVDLDEPLKEGALCILEEPCG